MQKAANQSWPRPRLPIAPAARPRKGRSVADLTKELKEAREQQTATAQKPKALNSSPGDLTPVFDIILAKTHNLCDVPCAACSFMTARSWWLTVRGMTEPFEKYLRQGYRISIAFAKILISVIPCKPPILSMCSHKFRMT